MFGSTDRRLHPRAHRWALAVFAMLALSPGVASAAPENPGANTEPSLAGRLGEIAGSVYDKAQSHLVAPSRQAAEALLAHPRTEEIYRQLSETAHDLAALADRHILQPMSRESAEILGRPAL